MNILFSCAGRRNYLLQYFKNALAGSGSVFATDSSLLAPTMAEADESFLVPPVNAENYLEVLLGICKDNKVGMVISLNDHELPILAAAKDRFAEIGTQVVVSDLSVIELCFDKGLTERFSEEIGIKTSLTFTSLESATQAIEANTLKFPIFVKPRWGSGSAGIEKVENMHELNLAWEFNNIKLNRWGLRVGDQQESGLLIQQALPGHEYGIDIINDLEGNYQATFVKQKLGMRAGETDKAKTLNFPIFEEIGRKISAALGHIGNLDCDFFVDGDDIYLLEMNPRFGGGYPFSAEAGVDVPAALIAWALGKEPDASWKDIKFDVTTAKCDRLVKVSEV